MGLFSPGIPTDGSALEGFLRHNIADAIWENYSGNRIINDLRSAGAAIREAKFFQIRGEILGFQRFFANLERLGANSIVPHSNFIYEHGWQLSQNFLYNFRVNALNNKTGETELINFSFSSNHEQTLAQLRFEVKRSLEANTDETNWTVISATLRFALVAPGVFKQT